MAGFHKIVAFPIGISLFLEEVGNGAAKPVLAVRSFPFSASLELLLIGLKKLDIVVFEHFEVSLHPLVLKDPVLMNIKVSKNNIKRFS